MIRALMLAQPFGFGPTGSLLDARHQLDSMPCRWRFAGPSYAREIVDEGLFEGCTFSERPWSEEPSLLPDLDWADVVFSGTEFSMCDAIERAGKRLVVVDPLFWWWPRVPAVSFPSMIYLCQNFVGVRERLALVPSPMRERFFLTPPTGGVRSRSQGPGDDLLVHLGGLTNPVHSPTNYPGLALSWLREALDRAPPMKVLITGNAGALAQLSAETSDARISFHALHREQMLAAMGRARLFLTVPGLNAAMEGFRMGVPTAFLPATNASQADQLVVFQQAGLTLTAMDLSSLTRRSERWRAVGPEQALAGMEQQAIVELEQSLRGDDAELRRSVVDGLARIVGASNDELRALQARQKLFLASLAEAEGVRTIREILVSDGVFSHTGRARQLGAR
jgi:hypothetical protein